ncbi:HTH-type transcriptional regulator HexR [Sinobacterium norvegicum]|uniref:HTH-type transcriptional regulator HexR n=1 Tax=Sinobacterium norvegicum TaxID=1641715 RepID=A0ABN8EL27_9GAMM|nr:transcriptional regulator HexR [Sinobacterium norvegicum]CAH0993110.1 HTH-type transcriptional regulator HexR [Sinobacterium norvegicum]
MRSTNLLHAIDSNMENMRRSERKVAEYVLSKPQDIIHMRIVDLAQEAHVSEPTVVRFCRAIGCDGFQNFKLALAQQLASAPSFVEYTVEEYDSIKTYSAKVIDATIETLTRVRDAIDPQALDQAITALSKANRVDFYGFGGSSSVAQDAQHKFFRLQLVSAAYSDAHIQTMSALSLGEKDVVVAISQTGRTQALIDSIALAQQAGATVISLSPSGTPVSSKSDIPIFIDVDEDTEIFTPISSRIAHLSIIDILAVGVAKSRGAELTDHLKKIKSGLQPLRIQPKHQR